MKRIKIIDKIILIFLTIIFIVSFYITTCLYGGIVEDKELLIAGAIGLTVNIFAFRTILKTLYKYFNDKSKENVKVYLYTMLIFSVAVTLYIPFLGENRLLEFLLYIIQYYIIIRIYLYVIDKYFGDIIIKINRTSEGIFVNNSTNKTINVRLVDNKNIERSFYHPVEDGDKIILENKNKKVFTLTIDK